MRKQLMTLAAAAILALTVLAIPSAQPIHAQGDQPIVCDSTLITLLYVAEHDYGFHSMMDVSKFDKGQFAPLFDAMMKGMMESTPEAMMDSTPEMMMESTPAMMESTPEAMMGTELRAGAVAGEPEACTQLRAEVEGYLSAKFSEGMMMK
ncbi:MAG: hypothetical protein KF716_19410 [Anaerolineae bacterium]|nr:hypothetical protein [Anaerolineae bacterium]